MEGEPIEDADAEFESLGVSRQTGRVASSSKGAGRGAAAAAAAAGRLTQGAGGRQRGTGGRQRSSMATGEPGVGGMQQLGCVCCQ
jgi:hypothetical protein